MNKSHKDTIKVCACPILAHNRFEGEQFVLTLASKTIAQNTKAGQFVHITVSDALPMRRPISVMSVDVENGSFDLLYKAVGEGTRQLAQRKVGDVLSVIGPIGNGFALSDKKLPLLIGGGVGMPPMIAIAQQIKHSDYDPFVILGSEVPFPFELQNSQFPNIADATATMPLLESWNIPCRLASNSSNENYQGVFKGFVTDLARAYLDTLTKEELSEVEIFSCGPEAMLKAVYEVSKEYDLPCQVSLEEFMACAVGGCAGCVVEIKTKTGVAMKRVCVDGPVFEADTVFL